MRKLILSLFLLLYSTTTSMAFTAINTNMVYEKCKYSITQNTNTCQTTVEYDESCERKDWCADTAIPYTDIYPNNEHPEYDYIQTCTIQPPLDPCKLSCTMTCLYECANGYYASTLGSYQTPVGTYARGYIYRTGGAVYNVDNPSQSTGTLPHNGYYYNYITCAKCPTGYICENGIGKTGCADGYKRSYDSNNQLVCTKCSAIQICVDGEVKGCNDTSDVGYYLNEAGTCIVCPAGHYCPDRKNVYPCSAGTYNPNTGLKLNGCQLCEAGSYSDKGATSCKTCPTGYYCPGGQDKQPCPGKPKTSNVICNSQNPCTNKEFVTNLEDLKAIYTNLQINNAYPLEITAIISVAIPSYLTSKKNITECGVTYTVTNQRGTFVQEQIMYNETTRRYDSPNNTNIYYEKILPGYYAKTKLYTPEQCTSTSNRQKLYTNAVLCPAGKYCTGFKDDMPDCGGDYPDVLGISGNIAAGYFSNGGATSAQPNSTTPSNGGTGCVQSTECPDGGCFCGYVAPGHYSTGGGTLFSPSGPGKGCLDGFYCGAIAAGYYSTGGATSEIPTQCVAGGECGVLAGGHFATCGAKKKNPTIPQSGTNPDCTTGCECGYTDEGYYSSGGGTLFSPSGPGKGCLTGFQCGPCNREKNEICPRGSSSKQACEAGKYCQISSTDDTILIKNNCPVGTTSNAGATAITNCFIKGGTEGTKFCINNDKCFNLPAGTTINLTPAN